MGKRNDVYTENRNSLRKRIKEDFVRNRSLYLLVLPVVAFYLIFNYGPLYGALIAFKDYKPQLGMWGSKWVGFKHFEAFFTNPSFFKLLKNTLRISLTTLVFGFPAPIILALLLNELKSQKFAKIAQNITYMPHFVSLVVICGMLKAFCAKNGIINYVLAIFGHEPANLLVMPEYFTTIYVASGIWQEIGWGSIIYLAALTSVDAQLYDSAVIDGAGKWRQLISITIPAIVPTIITMLILRIGSIISVGYEKLLLLYNDATLGVADVINTYTYRKGLIDLDWSFSAAVGLFNSAVNLIFLVSANTISKKLSDTALW
ncbi:MAG: sugar ABC transporter permease [Clostridia bacterium]|nr:sugar ABC transporter permease [Clostridia bacterium]